MGVYIIVIFDVTDVSLSLMSWGIIVIVVKGVSLSLMSWGITVIDVIGYHCH